MLELNINISLFVCVCVCVSRGDLNTKTGAPTAAKKRGYRVPADLMNADPRFLKLGYLYRLTTALSEIGYFISSQLKKACNVCLITN